MPPFLDTQLTVSEASESLAVSIDTIRRWEKKGLLKGTRGENGHRYFRADELKKLQEKINGSGDVGYKVLKTSKRSQYRVVELFAGAGGLALGLENAGLQSVLLVEIDKHAAATLKHNRPKWNVVAKDIADVSFDNVEADIVTGGFPCQAFSYAGKRLGFEDTRGTLFFEYARAVKAIQPKVIVGENVRGLERHDGGRTLATMMSILEDFGYNVEYRVLRAQYLDVAQKRERLVIFGVRKDLNRAIAFPKERNYVVSLREALRDVPLSAGQRYTAQKHDVMTLIPPRWLLARFTTTTPKKVHGRQFSPRRWQDRHGKAAIVGRAVTHTHL